MPSIKYDGTLAQSNHSMEALIEEPEAIIEENEVEIENDKIPSI